MTKKRFERAPKIPPVTEPCGVCKKPALKSGNRRACSHVDCPGRTSAWGATSIGSMRTGFIQPKYK